MLLRGPRHLQLTPAGAELLGYARRMLELQAQAQAALFGPDLSGRVRLGVPDDYASTYLTPVLRSFAGRYQGVEIQFMSIGHQSDPSSSRARCCASSGEATSSMG